MVYCCSWEGDEVNFPTVPGQREFRTRLFVIIVNLMGIKFTHKYVKHVKLTVMNDNSFFYSNRKHFLFFIIFRMTEKHLFENPSMK